MFWWRGRGDFHVVCTRTVWASSFLRFCDLRRRFFSMSPMPGLGAIECEALGGCWGDAMDGTGEGQRSYFGGCKLP